MIGDSYRWPNLPIHAVQENCVGCIESLPFDLSAPFSVSSWERETDLGCTVKKKRRKNNGERNKFKREVDEIGNGRLGFWRKWGPFVYGSREYDLSCLPDIYPYHLYETRRHDCVFVSIYPFVPYFSSWKDMRWRDRRLPSCHVIYGSFVIAIIRALEMLWKENMKK